MRIVFLGDSLTWGGYGGNYVDEVQKRLPDDEIINAGVGGNTVLNLLERLESDVLVREPDGVFVMIGGNDSISYVQPKTRPYYKQVQKVPDGGVDPDLFAETYRELLYQLQLAHVQTWMGLPPKEYNPATVEAMEQYNTLAAEVARSFNVPTLDLMAHFKPDHIPDRPEIDIGFIERIGKNIASGWKDYQAEQKRGGYVFTFDGLHLMPNAAKRMGELAAEFIRT